MLPAFASSAIPPLPFAFLLFFNFSISSSLYLYILSMLLFSLCTIQLNSIRLLTSSSVFLSSNCSNFYVSCMIMHAQLLFLILHHWHLSALFCYLSACLFSQSHFHSNSNPHFHYLSVFGTRRVYFYISPN